MLIGHLLETAEDDLRALRVAERWKLAFTDWMEKYNSGTPLEEIDQLFLWSMKAHDGRPMKVYVLSGWRIGLPDDLSIGIGWMDDGRPPRHRGVLISRIEENHRHYHLILMTDHNPSKETDVLWSLRIQSFVHEATHYLEHKRGYDAALDQQRLRGSKRQPVYKRGPKAYYNDPLELNAHSQQALSEMFIALAANLAQQEYYGEAKGVEWLASYNAFLGKFIDTSVRQKYNFLAHITEANKRKLIRRLYKVYSLIKAKWPDLAEIKQQAQDYVTRWRARDAAEHADSAGRVTA